MTKKKGNYEKHAGLDNKTLKEILEQYREEPDALLDILQAIHQRAGYIPDSAVFKIAEVLEISPAGIYEIVKYYPYLRTTPVGKHKIHVCLGTSCYLHGSPQVLKRFCSELGIEPGETTRDRKYSLEVVRCLGACTLGPVIMINDVIHPQVQPDDVPDILNTLE